MDYEKEVQNLEQYQNKDWYKPKPGTTKIVILSEPTPGTYKDDEGNITELIELEISIAEKMFSWSIGKGKTMASLYGQLMSIGKAKGKLMGETITLITKFDGKKNSYTLIEANLGDVPTEKVA